MAAMFEERSPGQPRFQGRYEKRCGRRKYWNLEFYGKTDQTENTQARIFAIGDAQAFV